MHNDDESLYVWATISDWMLDPVRAERFALIKEAIEEYDVDGFGRRTNEE